MAVNRVDFGGNTLIDLTGDTLESAEQLLKGIIAHAKDGSVITGQMEAGGGEENLFGAYFETGSIIPASDITTDYTIQFQRNFSGIDGNDNEPYYIFALWCSIPPGYTSKAIPNNSLAWIFVGRKKKSTVIPYGQYLTSSGSMSNLTYMGAIGANRSGNFILYCTPSKKLVAGYVYNWIALAPSSEGYAT